MEKTLFEEKQKFTQTWIWVLIIVSLLVPLLIIVVQLDRSWGTNRKETIVLLFSLAFLLVVAIPILWLFVRSVLIVKIDISGIRFKFPPLLYKWKCIRKDEIDYFVVREYKPIWEYGGWGIKGGFKKKAYNVSGNIGLDVVLKNGKTVLFGTQRKQAIEAAMNKLMGAK